MIFSLIQLRMTLIAGVAQGGPGRSLPTQTILTGLGRRGLSNSGSAQSKGSPDQI